jgi:hypothetical protein
MFLSIFNKKYTLYIPPSLKVWYIHCSYRVESLIYVYSAKSKNAFDKSNGIVVR